MPYYVIKYTDMQPDWHSRQPRKRHIGTSLISAPNEETARFIARRLMRQYHPKRTIIAIEENRSGT